MFFIIAASVMSLLIVSIHRLARHFGCELPLSSLVLCGLCAIVINFVIISVTPFLTKSYYYTAGAMITFAAFGTTCYNKYWLHRKLRLAGPAQLSAVPQADEQDEPVMVSDTLPEAQDEPVTAAAMLQNVQDEPVAAASTPLEDRDEPAVLLDAHDKPSPLQEIPPAVPEETAIRAEEPGVAIADTEADGNTATAAADITICADAADTDDTISADDTADTDAAGTDVADTDTAADDRTADADSATADNPEADDKLAATLAAMTTMDQLLDFAFEHNMQKDHPVALAAYTEALARYRDDGYAPFIVVSIANIHKELGNYQAAIDSIQSAMDLPALLENESIKKQFEDTRLYLTATQNVLHMAGLGSISFKDIPKKYMSQIESIYNSRKSR